MTRAGRAGTATAALLALALFAGCAGSVGPTAPGTAAPRAPAPVRSGWPGCKAVGAFVDPSFSGDATKPAGGVPAGFVATSAVLCEAGEQTTARGDTQRVDLERTATDIGPLLTYLARRDELPSTGACSADAWLPPWLVLTDDDGRYVTPAIPVDGCGKPLGWYDDRDHMPWMTLAYSDRVVQQGEVVDSAEAKRAGCSMGWKDAVADYATSSHARSGTFAGDPFAGGSLRVCVYEVPAADRGSDAAPGAFVSGGEVDDADRTRLLAALRGAPETSPRCATPNARFATVAPLDGGPFVYVELDGCRRVVSDADETPVVRADDELVALLGG